MERRDFIKLSAQAGALLMLQVATGVRKVGSDAPLAPR